MSTKTLNYVQIARGQIIDGKNNEGPSRWECASTIACFAPITALPEIMHEHQSMRMYEMDIFNVWVGVCVCVCVWEESRGQTP